MVHHEANGARNGLPAALLGILGSRAPLGSGRNIKLRLFCHTTPRRFIPGVESMVATDYILPPLSCHHKRSINLICYSAVTKGRSVIILPQELKKAFVLIRPVCGFLIERTPGSVDDR